MNYYFNDDLNSKSQVLKYLEEIYLPRFSPEYKKIIEKYIQKDKYLKYNLFKRLNLWTQVSEQLVDYDVTLTKSIRKLDSVIKVKDDEITIIWWWF